MTVYRIKSNARAIHRLWCPFPGGLVYSLPDDFGLAREAQKSSPVELAYVSAKGGSVLPFMIPLEDLTAVPDDAKSEYDPWVVLDLTWSATRADVFHAAQKLRTEFKDSPEHLKVIDAACGILLERLRNPLSAVR